ncbi:MAG TPA: electron transfer flavoprotein subunit beta/FixA family protein [Spirochaetota bacterium]|nr:electron transfer flavoprotein subunit beta/FixA family protein [Spirochaetota bacterium]HPJ43367.1 electron transfer flavoprotein subunit beta/FixA family protein [Spirochaetota bacterium]HRX48434.1 electron transfer flavoprotein subunit beta/FixA family protein [Spirochaetota bacterium]
MKILVCIKQVPDAESNPEIRRDSLWIEEDNIAFRFNRYDEYALEEALLIREMISGTMVDVITVGPERAAAVLTKGLEKGADNAVHIKCDRCPLTSSQTAHLISNYASGKNYDIIFAGVMSEDAMQCTTGPMIASLLSIPCAVSALKTSVDFNKKSIAVESELEGGIIETIELSIPCLVTVQTGIKQPRYPSLSGKMRARGIKPVVINGDCIEDDLTDTLYTLNYPESGVKGLTVTGSAEEKAVKLMEILHEKGLII